MSTRLTRVTLGVTTELNGIGQMIVEARLRHRGVFAEPGHDTDLVRLHPVKAARAPDAEQQQSDEQNPLAAQRAAGQHVLQPVLATAQDFFQIGRLVSTTAATAGTGRLVAPGATAATATGAPPTSALVAPGHVRPSPMCVRLRQAGLSRSGILEWL